MDTEVEDDWMERMEVTLDETTTSLSLCYRELEHIPKFHKHLALNITYLDLSHNMLSDLKNLDVFAHLEHLVLDNNNLGDSTEFPELNTLTALEMNNNQFVNLNLLVKKLAKAFPMLTYLSLLGNNACPIELSGTANSDKDYQYYRQFTADNLPKLKFLDFKIVDKRSKEEEKEHVKNSGNANANLSNDWLLVRRF